MGSRSMCMQRSPKGDQCPMYEQVEEVLEVVVEQEGDTARDAGQKPSETPVNCE